MFGYARPFGLAAAAAALSFTTAGVAHAAPAPATATATASVANNTLTITGTNGGDSISMREDTTTNVVEIDLGNGTLPQSFPRADFTKVAVFLGADDDKFNMAPSGTELADLPVTVHGGAGNDFISSGPADDNLFGGAGADTIFGGDGTDTIFGGPGGDVVNGNRGNDTEVLGGGQDTALWNPGEGSDTINGGGGQRDALLFNGADVSENTSLSANGHQVVFLRDVAAIRMDLNNVEAFDFNALGGADTVTVNNLDGTDLRFATVNLGTPATPDGSADVVTVNGSNRADHISADAYNGFIEVAGLHTTVQVTNADPTLDALQINGLGGNDTASVSAAAQAAIGVLVDLGIGQY